MDIAPISRVAVPDAAYVRIVEEILSGRVTPGDALPAERELALAFQVNRHAIREALKRVQQAGLIRITHGGKTRVLDWRENARLETLSDIVAAGVVPPLEIVRDVAVMRRSIGADAARLCAVNAPSERLERIADIAHTFPEQGTAAEYGEADLEFWIAVIDGSGNLAYRLALNSLVATFDDLGLPLIAEWIDDEYTDRAGRIALADLIAARDSEGAYRQAESLLTHFVARSNQSAPEN
ncbi:GntR family transcriptional regulator [Nocardia sp. NEAU-G5]|uniref:GntR family transcriptional regulator n=1 Tax=Nocardia albiluteola TaxID=2842303 RepID=A0ABS6B1C6_9NOCA|nr:GntR family transcriptional regulator [Nocardia albiluteola]MBU3063029.1 GntR family transcriptional regulator [Nocardia albiluteola]